MGDSVKHPEHYTSHPSGIEAIEVTRHHNFDIGNAIKYLWRQGLKKDPDRSALAKQIEDLRKARWYIKDEIKRLQGLSEDSQEAAIVPSIWDGSSVKLVYSETSHVEDLSRQLGLR